MSGQDTRGGVGLGKKRVSFASERESAYLNQLSKQALIDLVVDLMVRAEGEDARDDEVMFRVAMRDVIEPIVRLRGDRMPKS